MLDGIGVSWLIEDLRPDLPGASGWPRAKRLLVAAGYLVVLAVGMVLVGMVLGLSDPADDAVGAILFGVGMLVGVPRIEYVLLRRTARRGAPAGASEPGAVVPCGVVEWSDDRGLCLPGGLKFPPDGPSPVWWPATGADDRRLVLSTASFRVAGFRRPRAKKSWGTWSRLVLVVLVGDDGSEVHLCLTPTDARTLAACYRQLQTVPGLNQRPKGHRRMRLQVRARSAPRGAPAGTPRRALSGA